MSVTEVLVKFICTQTFGKIVTEVGTWAESRKMDKASVGDGKWIRRQNYGKTGLRLNESSSTLEKS